LTQKPVELATRAIEYSSRPGENVLDLFGGSGSTLIGCEQTGRRAFLMELDPLYCDVIAQRFMNFAGPSAQVKLIRDGKEVPFTLPEVHASKKAERVAARDASPEKTPAKVAGVAGGEA
jgi:16S rRNA G966 N2-methylase RsmD